jgi:hypothetical protein
VSASVAAELTEPEPEDVSPLTAGDPVPVGVAGLLGDPDPESPGDPGVVDDDEADTDGDGDGDDDGA